MWAVWPIKFDVGGLNLYLTRYENDKPTLIIEQGVGRSGPEMSVNGLRFVPMVWQNTQSK